MFYDAVSNRHGLAHDPFKALVAPRPIGWISSRASDGTLNLAPYSFFNAISSDPHMVMFSSAGFKDSVANIEATGEFVCNLATWDLREQMNKSSATVAAHVDEFALSGLTPAPCQKIEAPRVAESPVAFECKLLEIKKLVDLNGAPVGHWMVLGQVVGIHIDERYVHEGLVDVTQLKPIARLGYRDYSVVTDVFQMTRPSG